MNLVLRTLRCRNTPSYTDPVLVFLLSWTADVDGLTQLGCEHVSRFRRACHISFSVASSSIHVCMHGLLTLGIVVYHTDVLIFTQRLPFFRITFLFRTSIIFIFTVFTQFCVVGGMDVLLFITRLKKNDLWSERAVPPDAS